MHRHISQTILALTRFGYIASAAALVVTCLIASQDTLAQDFGGGGGIDDLTQLQQQNTPTGNAGGIGGGGGGIGGGNGLGTFGSEEVDLLSGIGIDDVRNQGFVGATGTRIQELGFVGPPGETSAPPLADGASFGGGVNDGAGGGGGNFPGRGQQNGFGGVGQTKGFQVIRKGVRTALSPRFKSTAISTAEISARFNNRIRRQPVIANDGGGLFVSIENRVATVMGRAQDEAERNRFIRQLRLEPGIDTVIDQVNR